MMRVVTILILCCVWLRLPSATIVCLGDSLTAGFGLERGEAWPERLQELLVAEGANLRVVNHGVSGDTSGGALERVAWVLRARPALVVVAIGANDGLRGLDLTRTEANIRAIVERLQAGGARVLLSGMQMPPNLGEPYRSDFAAIFPRIAEQTGCAFDPFLLTGVAADPALNLPDGSHPNAAGHQAIAARLAPVVLAAVMETSRE